MQIVTNANKSWVTKCLDMHMPRLKKRLAELHALDNIASARDMFKEMYPTEPKLWKVRIHTLLQVYICICKKTYTVECSVTPFPVRLPIFFTTLSSALVSSMAS